MTHRKEGFHHLHPGDARHRRDRVSARVQIVRNPPKRGSLWSLSKMVSWRGKSHYIVDAYQAVLAFVLTKALNPENRIGCIGSSVQSLRSSFFPGPLPKRKRG